MSAVAAFALAALTASAAAPPQAVAGARPNVVLILVDDVGVDLIGAYGESPDPACTPNIDALAARGLLFRNVWTNPLCTPSRAQILTGRHALRTGVGDIVKPGSTAIGLPLSETTLPEMMIGYESAAAGKWHLADPSQGAAHPLTSGFGQYAGSLFNLKFHLTGQSGTYFDWVKNVNGALSLSNTYATTDTTDDAIDAARTMTGPWLLYVSYNAAHKPLHTPPPPLAGRCGDEWLPQSGPPSKPASARDLVAALDIEIGRLLEVVREVDPNALVIFLSDNGTARDEIRPPFISSHGKSSLYEGGVNVPLIVAGPGVRRGESRALVSSTDIFATLAELAGVPNTAEDSVSLVRYFSGPRLSIRKTVYAEKFRSAGGVSGPPFTKHERAVRDRDYKLIRRDGRPDELYDLRDDPYELHDLFPQLGPGTRDKRAHARLERQLMLLGVD